MKGALQTMFLQKLKVVAATAVVVLTLGVGGLAYRAGGQTAPGEQPAPRKPRTELEALRRENQLLKLNLEVVLEKVAALESEVRALRGKTVGKGGTTEADLEQQRDRAAWAARMAKKGFLSRSQAEAEQAKLQKLLGNPFKTREGAELPAKAHADLVKQAEDALRALRNGGAEEQRKAAEALEKALRALKGNMKPGSRLDDSILRPNK
jgi:hypothetical protein